MIALIDYGAGNLTSVKKALATLGAEVFVPTAPHDLSRARGVIVPGVGHFDATRAIDANWTAAIVGALGEGRPLFGICLGMQWLFEGSDEAPDCPGLGVLGGRCYRLGQSGLLPAGVSPPGTTVKVPHVGWNALEVIGEAPILDHVASGSQVYFTHSYVAPITGDTVAHTEHGERFAAIVQRGQVSGVQFHPEKSGEVGLTILRNFLKVTR